MNKEIIEKIYEEITAYQRIIIMRHVRPDGDAVGATLGLREILRDTFPKKEIFVINEDTSEYVAFLGEEDPAIDDGMYSDALGIVVDTGTADRISNKKYSLCREIIKIDHHIEETPFGDISWVEEERSSACEMITAFYYALSGKLKLSKTAATCLYAGMVTDTGRFRYDSTCGDTLRLASVLLDTGIDTETLFARLYLDDFKKLQFRAYIYKIMKITENGVAYFHIKNSARKRLGLSQEEASSAISLLDSIKGSIVWLGFIENDDGSTRVRLRSRFVTVQGLATLYHGGGHAKASGATVYSRSEMKALIADADDLVKEYKASNEGWL